MHEPGVEESIPVVVLVSHYFQLTPGPGSKESGWVNRQRKSAWLNGLSNGQALTLPRGWWMNERVPLSFQQWPGFLSQPAPRIPPAGGKGRKANPFSLPGTAGHRAAIPRPRFPSSPQCWHVAAAEVVSSCYEMQIYLQDIYFHWGETQKPSKERHMNEICCFVCPNRKTNLDPFENVVLLVLWAE